MWIVIRGGMLLSHCVHSSVQASTSVLTVKLLNILQSCKSIQFLVFYITTTNLDDCAGILCD